MNLNIRIETFLSLNPIEMLNEWKELLSIGNEFVEGNYDDEKLARKIADAILSHRSLMGSSKAYEAAFDIDTDLLEVSIPIARIAYGKTKPLISFLKSGIYYSTVLPNRFDKAQLQEEIENIQR